MCTDTYSTRHLLKTPTPDYYGILPKGPYPPRLRMADRALLAGYPRLTMKYITSWCGMDASLKIRKLQIYDEIHHFLVWYVAIRIRNSSHPWTFQTLLSCTWQHHVDCPWNLVTTRISELNDKQITFISYFTKEWNIYSEHSLRGLS